MANPQVRAYATPVPPLPPLLKVLDRRCKGDSRLKIQKTNPVPSPDPAVLFPRALSKLHSIWLSYTYPFHSLGKNFYAHYSADIRRPVTPHIKIGDDVFLDRDVWLNIPYVPENTDPVIILEDECKIGRRAMISAKNRIHVGRQTAFAPNVLLMDHNHAFEDVTIAIGWQGITQGGTIRIEEGCLLGYGVAVVCSKGELVIGKNSVIGANSVVTRSIPPYSVVSGNPGRVVKQFDPSKGQWLIGMSGVATKD